MSEHQVLAAKPKRKRSASMTPTQKSLNVMRERGFTCEIVERWNPYAKIRQDLFGFIDLLCVSREGVVAVQTTSSSSMSARRTKIANHEHIGAVREAGVRILLHGWDGTRLREEDLS
jgi:hypothetical protein